MNVPDLVGGGFNLTDFSTAGGNGEAFAACYDHDDLPYRTVRGGVTVDLICDADGARERQSRDAHRSAI